MQHPHEIFKRKGEREVEGVEEACCCCCCVQTSKSNAKRERKEKGEKIYLGGRQESEPFRV